MPGRRRPRPGWSTLSTSSRRLPRPPRSSVVMARSWEPLSPAPDPLPAGCQWQRGSEQRPGAPLCSWPSSGDRPLRPHRRQVPRRRDTRALTTADPNSMPRAADGFLTELGESRAVDAGTISPETARPPTPVPSTKPDTRRGLLRASSRERSAPPGNGASPPGRRGRRPASSHHNGSARTSYKFASVMHGRA